MNYDYDAIKKILEANDFPEDKASIAVARVMYKFFELCETAVILNFEQKHAEEREQLLNQALREIIEAGPAVIQLDEGEILAKKLLELAFPKGA